MATLQLGNKTLFTQSGSNNPEITSNVNLTNADMSNADIKTAFNSLDTSASNGPTTDLTSTTLPIFGCRAFVNFNGTSTTSVGGEDHCLIRASGNISKVVKSSVGIYVIHFITAMPDSNYVCIATSDANPTGWGNSTRVQALSSTDFTIRIVNSQVSGSGSDDGEIICTSIFR